MANQTLSKIVLPGGQVLEIKDATARAAVAAAGNLQYSVVTELPENPKDFNAETIIYLVSKTGATEEDDVFDEYIYIQDKWEHLGNTNINLNDYVKEAELGALAKKNSVSATYTPEGSVSGTGVVVDLEKVSMQSVTSVGTLPSYTDATYTYDAGNETLTIGAAVFDTGTLPTQGEAINVATNISKVTVTDPTFTGTPATIESK